jgi:hypothetical protein
VLETDAFQLSPSLAVVPDFSNSAGDPGEKARSICEAFRAAMPSYDSIVRTLANNGAWWSSWWVKMRVYSGSAAIESLEALAARAYTSKNPAELGTLLVAYARSAAGDFDELYALVESLVTSDQTYMATAEGMKCLVLLAKTRTDIGQPRKAWILWHQAMTLAQYKVRRDCIPWL